MAFGYPGYPGYLLPFFMGEIFLIIYIYIIKLLYIPQFQKKNTRWVTEVTGVTMVLIELLTPEADWVPVTAVTPVTSCLFLWGKCF